MKKKWIKRFLVIVGLFIITGIAVSGYKKQKKVTEVNRRLLEYTYFLQNDAFCANTTEYAPYSALELNYLQAYLNYYYEEEEIVVTLSDVEEFLKEQYNKDGTPKTYLNDDGVIYDYVEYFTNRRTSFDRYISALHAIIVDYIRENPGCPYRTIRDVPINLIDELSKKYHDEDYELILE